MQEGKLYRSSRASVASFSCHLPCVFFGCPSPNWEYLITEIFAGDCGCFSINLALLRLHPQALMLILLQPDEASSRDRDTLTSTHGIHTVIDLRSSSEHAEQISKHADTSFRIPGMDYREIDLIGKGFPNELLSRLSWWDYS